MLDRTWILVGFLQKYPKIVLRVEWVCMLHLHQGLELLEQGLIVCLLVLLGVH